MYDPQVYGLLGAILLLHLGVLLYVYLRRNSGTAEAAGVDELPVEPTRREADADVDPEDGGTVVCPECGTRNATGYDFCRHCVADLPGGVPGEGGEAFSSTA
jgi:hypothetical protein